MHIIGWAKRKRRTSSKKDKQISRERPAAARETSIQLERQADISREKQRARETSRKPEINQTVRETS